MADAVTVDVGVGIERHLQAEEIMGNAVYVAKQAGLDTVATARFCIAASIVHVPTGGTLLGRVSIDLFEL